MTYGGPPPPTSSRIQPKKDHAIGDQSKAVALCIAERKLNELGWKYGSREVGKYAAEILLSLETALETPKQ